jgi:predicted DNA-binding transcriptional regulator AlpA
MAIGDKDRELEEFAGNYLTTDEAAQVMRLSPHTLENFRVSGFGPAFIKLGRGKRSKVVYDRADIDAWLEGRKCKNTGQCDLLDK